MVGYAGAIQIPNNNAFVGRNGYRPRYIILHATAGGSSAQNIASYFQSTQGGSDPVSANYVVGQDGTVVMCNQEEDGAWANGVLSSGHDSFWNEGINPNLITISIEHVKPSTDNSDTLTPAQQAASFKLIADICNRWGIPKQLADGNGGITGHFSIDPVNRSQCPGPYPWDALWSYLQGQGNTSTSPAQEAEVVINLQDNIVAGFFQESPASQWLAPRTGKHIKGAILTWYQRFGGDAKCGLTYLGLPITEEIDPKQPNHPECRVQAYERGVVAYDPAHVLDGPPSAGDVYLLHIEQAPQFSAVNSKLSALQAAYNAVVSEKNGLIATRDQDAQQLAQNATTIAQNEAQIATLQKEMATSNAANTEQLQAQIDSLNVKNAQLATEISTLQTENSGLTTKINAASDAIKQILSLANAQINKVA